MPLGFWYYVKEVLQKKHLNRFTFPKVAHAVECDSRHLMSDLKWVPLFQISS